VNFLFFVRCKGEPKAKAGGIKKRRDCIKFRKKVSKNEQVLLITEHLRVFGKKKGMIFLTIPLF